MKPGFCPLFEKFFGRVRTVFKFLAKKNGQKPIFKNQKWAEKIGGIFSKQPFLGKKQPFLADLRKFAYLQLSKSPLAHFFSLFNCDKKINIIIDRKQKRAFGHKQISHSTSRTKSLFLLSWSMLYYKNHTIKYYFKL